ncbi:MAG: DUF1080 domain-containing protein [Pedobacter sp.]|nr:MAG: DUF1080 domain-containing protein [Pedobacter sp.]
MIFNKIRLYTLSIIAFFCLTTSNAQSRRITLENNTINTLLSRLPAQSSDELTSATLAMTKMTPTTLSKLVGKLESEDKIGKTKAEYAIAALSEYVSRQGKESSRKVAVAAYSKSLAKITDQQIQSFLISQFELIGKDDSVPLLTAFLSNQFLSDPAVRALVKVNSPSSKAALLKALPESSGTSRLAIVKALGDLKYKPAANAINGLTGVDDPALAKMAFYALSYIADPISEPLFSAAANKVGYKYDNTNVVASYLIYGDQLLKSGNLKLAGEIGRKIITGSKSPDLVATRTNALKLLIDLNAKNVDTYLPEAATDPNLEYFAAALKFATPHLSADAKSLWGSKLELAQIAKSDQLPEQRLLLLRELFDRSKNTDAQISILKLAEEIKIFNTIGFASQYLDNPSLQQQAASTVIEVALSGNYSGDFVKETLTKALTVLNAKQITDNKSRVENYVNAMKPGQGFMPLFNGKDLTGWKGLVADPIKRSKMDAKTLEAQQIKADAEMRDSWTIKDGELLFTSHGNNLATVKKYGDFEMLVDWKIIDDKKGEGDAGIYLRGTPQVQMWDNARTNVGAQVGSGGLYNNQVNPSKPLKVADNPLDHWNTFRIIMKGDRVTVYLNGELVTDNVILENYWDKNQAIFPVEQIELQAHGSPVAYRDIYIKELPAIKPFELSAKEKRSGFKLLFDGTNMFSWIGNTADYISEDGNLSVSPKPGKGSGGNLYTKEEFSDFIFRFEFQLTPGANNGLGIRTPLEGDAAYVGMELQILDNEAPMYKDLHVYQYHGSVYGTLPAKRGYLKPVGEWNYQEVIVKGPKIKVVLNGKVILDGDISEARKNGAADKQQHPGLLRDKGHIAFLGHGSPLKFRNIRIKDLSKPNIK